ncbi:hypothetical protein E2C01_040339 [Portunus trituberculatus]|uniref:Uncharacterized protein n=1 Tax=Portunus trituberculatus TaxID=210409 RepID=A0A5B7FMA9_PORTR|nr:hypothetical protein [Portunus trituberculatus]
MEGNRKRIPEKRKSREDIVISRLRRLRRRRQFFTSTATPMAAAVLHLYRFPPMERTDRTASLWLTRRGEGGVGGCALSR